ncbi:hypothetical protein UPYG_G00280110 [Umbra pygmaea]|uniref:Maturase K n=1 Tax=Umbra pygmaea TaxID=75934 RepID=A0ABD0W2Y9_UMBPY
MSQDRNHMFLGVIQDVLSWVPEHFRNLPSPLTYSEEFPLNTHFSWGVSKAPVRIFQIPLLRYLQRLCGIRETRNFTHYNCVSSRRRLEQIRKMLPKPIEIYRSVKSLIEVTQALWALFIKLLNACL